MLLPDPVGLPLESFDRPNGLRIEKIIVPLGVIGMIYEARPNVTVDAAGLCLKTGNAVVLARRVRRLESNRRIIEILRAALAQTDIPADALQLIEDPIVHPLDEMLKLNGLLDVVIPRGGASLIKMLSIMLLFRLLRRAPASATRLLMKAQARYGCRYRV